MRASDLMRGREPLKWISIALLIGMYFQIKQFLKHLSCLMIAKNASLNRSNTLRFKCLYSILL